MSSNEGLAGEEGGNDSKGADRSASSTRALLLSTSIGSSISGAGTGPSGSSGKGGSGGSNKGSSNSNSRKTSPSPRARGLTSGAPSVESADGDGSRDKDG